MTVALLILLLAACDPQAMAVVAAAAARVEAFDLPGAIERLRAAPACDEAAGGADYLEGLAGAAAAVAQGGTVDSLRDVRSAANALSRRAEGGMRRWEAAALVMRAVAAASQYERDEMSLFLAEAVRVEALLLAAGQPPVPFITAHEMAGDLWLQVHRFDTARAAYEKAKAAVGATPRVRLGLARTAARQNNRAAACAEFAALLSWWDREPRAATPPPVAEAREYVRAQGCGR